MQHRRRKSRIAPAAVVGLAWFSPEEWHKLIAIVPNRSELDDTFEQWEANANQAFRDITAQGVKATKVMVVVDELVEWCREKGRALNSASRAEFVSHFLLTREKSSGANQS